MHEADRQTLAMNGRTLYIIRGVPGTGKTTLAHILAGPSQAAADDFMIGSSGQYEFDPSKLSEAHEKCLEKIVYFLKAGATKVAVHNTFTTKREMAPYIKAGEEHGYVVQILTCETSHGSIHGVPDTTIQRMRDRFEPIEYYAPQGVKA